MGEAIAVALSIELVTLFVWWRKGGWGDVVELASMIARALSRKGGQE